MAWRAVRVGPDSIYETLDGRRFGVVSRQRQAEKIIDFLTVMDVVGGGFTVLPGRESTGVPGEMVTTELLLKWQDRTDAKPQYEEPVRFEGDTGVGLFGSTVDDLSPEEPGVEIEYVDEPHIGDNGVVHHAEDAAAV
jgi:hypothetical protein